MEEYHPEFKITPEITNLLYQIARDLERIDIVAERVLTPKLRRENRVKTIRSSLYIEANTLSINQVSDIIDGKTVIGPKRDIDEVKGAKEAYDHLLTCDPFSIEDLLSEHALMMGRVIQGSGHFRNRGVAVFAGDQPIHLAPLADIVPKLMENLFRWYKESTLPIVLKSSIFHYEFEFIHPFADGNGRTGRLWQTLLLYQENSVFGWLPIETIIAANQERYYDAIRQSTAKKDSGIFAEFMLSIIAKAVSDFRHQHDDSNSIQESVWTEDEQRVLQFIEQHPSANYSEIAEVIGKTEKTVGRIISELKSREVISRVGSNKNGSWTINRLDDAT